MVAHAALGASNAHRWLVCAGSVEAERDIPNTTSPFAEEGTRAHDLGELALRTSDTALDAFEDQEMADFVRVYTDYVRQNARDADLLEIEQRVSYADWIEGGFGTADAVIIKDGVIHVCDLKYGMGVRVHADLNPQGMLYALGAYAENRFLGIEIHTAKISIVQPRLDHVSEWEISIEDLLRWAEWAKQRAEATQDPDAPRVAGEKQCRFCRAKASCKALQEVTEAAVMVEFDDLDNMPKANTLTDAQMRSALDAKPLIESWLSAIEKLAKGRLEDGEDFAGYKLVAGRSNRRWVADENTTKELVDLLGEDDAYTKKLVTPAQAEKLLGKKRASEITDFVVKSEGAPTLAPEADKRPAINISRSDFNDCTQ